MATLLVTGQITPDVTGLFVEDGDHHYTKAAFDPEVLYYNGSNWLFTNIGAVGSGPTWRGPAGDSPVGSYAAYSGGAIGTATVTFFALPPAPTYIPTSEQGMGF